MVLMISHAISDLIVTGVKSQTADPTALFIQPGQLRPVSRDGDGDGDGDSYLMS